MQNFTILQTIMRSLFSDSVNSAWQNSLKDRMGSLISSTSRRDMLGEALSGKIRSDSAMLRQASRNVLEAEGMMSLASEGAGEVSKLLKEARGLAEKYQASTDPVEQSQLELQYNALRSNIDGVIKNTAYNGISLLDGGKWGRDDRVKASGDNTSGSVQIYAGNSGFDLSLSNARKSIYEPLSSLSISAADAADKLSEMETTSRMMSDTYARRAVSLKSQAGSLERQAGILDRVAESQSGSGQKGSLQDMLVDLAMNDRGRIISGRG